MEIPAWETLGNVPARQLREARLSSHHAVQLVAAVGRSLVPARPDDGHTSLEWHEPSRSLVGEEAPGTRPWRAALRPADLSLAVLAEGAEVGRLALAGRTRREAFAWLLEQARALDASAERLGQDAPYALPAHAVLSGAGFAAPADGSLVELARWFADADALLRGVAGGWTGSAPVRVWPHHFDVGSVLPLGPPGGENAPQIGVGMSPGDEEIAEPYLYVTPWPPPPAGESLPDLPGGGRWHREGWTGAVLAGSEVVDAGGGAAQAAAASAFLTGAIDVLRARHEKRGA
jgi:hypothetical protein